jgi:hypothetical protein
MLRARHAAHPGRPRQVSCMRGPRRARNGRVTTVSMRATAVGLVLLCAAAATTQAPDARQPLPIDCPQILSDPTAKLPTWQPAPHALHGLHAFDHSVVLELPSTVASFEAEAWGGGGGGGGGGDDPSLVDDGAGGGGGASGGYARGVIPVLPQKKYVVVVGSGGDGGGAKQDGQRGTPSAVCENGNALLFADGGPGGDGAMTRTAGGTGGGWQETDVEDPLLEGALQRAGHDGHRGTAPVLDLHGLGGRGGTPIRGTTEPAGSFGGDGGAGAIAPYPAQRGADGGPGLVVIGW